MRALFTVIVLASAVAIAQYAPQQAGTAPLAPEEEQRVQALGKQLRCATCQGMSIADSPASMARAQLDTVRTLVQQGQSDQQIKDFFVERYGEFALLKPSATGINALVWLVPFAVFSGGIGFAVIYVLRHKAQKPVSAAPITPEPRAADAPSDDPYVNALRSELDR